MATLFGTQNLFSLEKMYDFYAISRDISPRHNGYKYDKNGQRGKGA